MPRTKRPINPDRLIEIAKLKFEQGWTNEDIALRFDVGTKKVAEMLKASVQRLLAREEMYGGLAESGAPQKRLEDTLQRRFPHLRTVKIVAGGEIKTEQQYNDLIKVWGTLAARYFDDELLNEEELREKDHSLHVAISGGETHLQVMNSLPDLRRHGVHFYASAFLVLSCGSTLLY